MTNQAPSTLTLIMQIQTALLTRFCSLANAARYAGKKPSRTTLVAVIAAVVATLIATPRAPAQVRLQDICRVKGQEENTLHGLGLVVGLDGTGDTETPTIRAMAKMLELLGNPVGQSASGQLNLDALENAKNVALVMVTATVPAEGARQGDLLNCHVSAFSAKSLQGGTLMITPLVGPRPDDPTIYATCRGPLSLDQNGPATVARIRSGCQMQRDVSNEFIKDGKFTLVLKSELASFGNAIEVQQLLIKSRSDFEVEARAIDQLNIEVAIPKAYYPDPVAFVSETLATRVYPPEQLARVVIDKRNGVVVVGKNVMVGEVAVSHNNIGVQTGTPPGDSFVILPGEQQTTTTRLEALVNSLNALKVSTEDIIAIIENLDRSGALFGQLVVQ